MVDVIPIEWFLRTPSKSKSMSRSAVKPKKIELIELEKEILNQIKKKHSLIDKLEKCYSKFSEDTDIVKLNRDLNNFAKKLETINYKVKTTKDDDEAILKRLQLLINRHVSENLVKFNKLYSDLYKELVVLIIEGNIKKDKKEIEKLGLAISQNFLDVILYHRILNSFYKTIIKDHKKSKEDLTNDLKTLKVIDKKTNEKIIQMEKYLLLLLKPLIIGGLR